MNEFIDEHNFNSPTYYIYMYMMNRSHVGLTVQGSRGRTLS